MNPTTWRPKPGAPVILSCSGGKDSTAAGLWLREQGIPFRAVFFDTGWESPITYDYLRDVLPGAFSVEIEARQTLPVMTAEREQAAVAFEQTWFDGKPTAMVRWIIHKAMFPSAVKSRWCTQYLKLETARTVTREIIAAHPVTSANGIPVSVVGVRAEESAARRDLPEVEMGDDAFVWRPLISWSTAEVVEIHKRNGIPLNPLYATRGVGRVGCWPCIGAGKLEIRAIAQHDPKRIDMIEALERLVGQFAVERTNGIATAPAFFQLGTRNSEGKRPCTPIREMVKWARTKRGGKVVDDREIDPFTSCTALGLCDLPGE
jgi:3'-phosphoadenosine 5'-phosphosulfate sulfotransferase (PAPS reductase)/FAD synthetase